jgi:hypothetical protein
MAKPPLTLASAPRFATPYPAAIRAAKQRWPVGIDNINGRLVSRQMPSPDARRSSDTLPAARDASTARSPCCYESTEGERPMRWRCPAVGEGGARDATPRRCVLRSRRRMHPADSAHTIHSACMRLLTIKGGRHARPSSGGVLQLRRCFKRGVGHDTSSFHRKT